MVAEDWEKMKKSGAYQMYCRLFDITESIWAEIDKIKEHNTRLVLQLENLDYELKGINNRLKEMEEQNGRKR